MPSSNPLAEMVAGGLRLPFEILFLLWRLLRFVMGAGWGQGQQHLGPYEKNRQRAVGAAFLLVFCLYVLHTGAWLFDQLPPWVRPAVIAVAGVSVLFVLAGLYGTRNGTRDLSAALASLVHVGGCAALLRWQWYLPRDYGAVAAYANWVLAGLYIAVLIAAVLRALICVQIIARFCDTPPTAGFWDFPKKVVCAKCSSDTCASRKRTGRRSLTCSTTRCSKPA